MNSRLFFRFGVGMVVAAIAGTASLNVAYADTSTPAPSAAATLLATLKQHCDAQVQHREATLSADIKRINSAADLSASDKATLLYMANGDASGLTALDATIQADTTLTQAHTDCQKIVSDYRIYVLFEPQVHLTIAADRLNTVVTKVNNVATELEQKLGSNPSPQVQSALADLQKQVSAAQSSLNGISAEVLALTPAGYPGNKNTLQSARSSLGTARDDLKAAVADLRTIRAALHRSTAASATPSPASNA